MSSKAQKISPKINKFTFKPNLLTLSPHQFLRHRQNLEKLKFPSLSSPETLPFSFPFSQPTKRCSSSSSCRIYPSISPCYEFTKQFLLSSFFIHWKFHLAPHLRSLSHSREWIKQQLFIFHHIFRISSATQVSVANLIPWMSEFRVNN